MREASTTPVRREDYVAPAYFIRSVELSFDLEPAKTIVASKMLVERNADAAPGQALRLDGEGLTLLRVLADGQSVSFRHEAGQLVIDNPPPGGQFTLELRNTCAPEKNTELSGLYNSGGGFFTQCEAEGFRRISYFLDRPDVMAEFTVTLRADKRRYPVLLSNGNLLDSGELGNGRHFAKWHDPFPKPSYLFAVVAADLVCREQRIRARSGKEHLLQIWVRRGELDKTEHAMHSLLASVAWDEARFGLSLDLERFMIVAVSDFNMGAMENKGLNIFNTKCVLASPATATDSDFQAIEAVIGHEYFHNWTGNRVTCRDWFQLSLKEGLTVYRDQLFTADLAGSDSARAVCRIAAVQALRAMQFPEDAGPMAHPVRPDRYQQIDNFYTPTVYEKGAEVVRMMATLVGQDGFRRGMDLYFQRHDGQAVTCDDFAQAIADANPGSALAEDLPAFKRWYAQPGTPRVSALGSYDPQTRSYRLSLRQSNPAGAGQASQPPQLIPLVMGLLGPDGAALPLRLAEEAQADGPQAGASQRSLILNQAEQSWTFVDLDAAPVHSLLRGFSAPVRLDDGLDDAATLHLLRHDSDAFNRWEASQRLALRRLLAALPADPRATAELAPLDDAYVAAMRALLRDPALDPAFKALSLCPPDEDFIAEQSANVNPQQIHRLRGQYLLQIAQALHADWVWAFEAHQPRQGYRPDPTQSGQRALANLALKLLVLDAVQRGDPVWPGRAYQRFKDAGQMTDRLGALSALIDAGSPLAEPALAQMYALFSGDELVVDKWFAAQAAASEPLSAPGSLLPKLKALLQHPAFSLKNPNRARSLLLTLCRRNPAAFHRSDAGGYVLWADKVLELDAINPQLAARLARAMDHWRRLAEPWRSAAGEALARVAARPDLSRDLREIVDKAMAG